MRLRSGTILSLAISAMFFTAGLISAGTNTETYLDVTAAITAPDTALPNTDFDLEVSGTALDGIRCPYRIYEGAVWNYDPSHRVEVTSGTLLHGVIFNFSRGCMNAYTIKKPAGVYTFTFIFGWRLFHFSGYDVAVDITVTVEDPSVASVIEVDIDIKPDSYLNSINLGSKGVTPVAILSSQGFDATEVDPSTIELAGAEVAVRGKGKFLAHKEDVDGDGLADLLVQVETEDLEPDEDGYACLTGKTYDGQSIKGCDDVVIVPLK